MLDAATLHVIPVGDVIEHDSDGIDICPCGPDSEWIIGQHGAHGKVVVHHSLDGRENWEEPHR
jgi:hypothetical protein